VISGSVASNTEVNPDGTNCSAQNTAPYVITNISDPMTSRLLHSLPEGRCRPQSRMTAYSSVPAKKNRDPAANSGGTCCTAIRIARYVEPHKT
jgi:hypothetical protein